MFSQLAIGGLVSIFNFGVHAVMTVIIVVCVSRLHRHTVSMKVHGRVTVLLAVTMLTLMATHIVEIAVWAIAYTAMGIEIQNLDNFTFAVENYTAIGYGDALPPRDQRLLGPLTALNGLLLIGWSVAVIFEVLRIAEVRFERRLVRRKRR